MTESEFNRLASAGFNRIPVITTVLADLETPISLYYKLAQSDRNGANSFLFESVVDRAYYGRYAYIGMPARTILRARNSGGVAFSEVVRNDEVIEVRSGNPLVFAESFRARLRYAKHPDLPPPCAALTGYFAPDAMTIRSQDRRGPVIDDRSPLPHMQALLTEELAILDRLTCKLYLVKYIDPAESDAYRCGTSRLTELRSRLEVGSHLHKSAKHPPVLAYDTRIQRHHVRAIDGAREMLEAGKRTCMQFTQSVSTSHRGDPLALYRALRSMHPITRMYFYRFNDLSLVGQTHEAASVSGIELIHEFVLETGEAYRRGRGASSGAQWNGGAAFEGEQS
jgi:anthranilate synthase component I